MHNQYSFRKFFNYERNYKTLPFGTEVFTERPETGLPIQAESIHRWSGICTILIYKISKISDSRENRALPLL